jgi:hypothetical protein
MWAQMAQVCALITPLNDAAKARKPLKIQEKTLQPLRLQGFYFGGVGGI